MEKKIGSMREMGEKRRRGHLNPAGFAGGLHDHEEKKNEEHKLDMSGMSIDALPHLTMSLGQVTILDLSNNNLEVDFIYTWFNFITTTFDLEAS